jgi:tyrosine-protein kinase Etk/Wzc
MKDEDDARTLLNAREAERVPRLPEPSRAWPPSPAGTVDEPTFRELAHVVLAGAWLVLGAVLLTLALGVAYLFLRAPTYSANVVVQVESNTPSLTRIDNLAAALGELPSEAEMEILRSRSLLESVVQDLGLEIEARPRTFPLIGAAFARRYTGPGLAPPRFGLDAYAWGGERIDVQRLGISDDLLDEPIPLTATGGGRFVLELRPGVKVEGQVGKPVTAERGGSRIEMFVSVLEARPGTRFLVTRHRRADVVEGLLRRLAVSERGKKTGILVAGLEGGDPVRVAAVVDGLASAYLRQSVERRSAEAAKTLSFLESQLPVLKDKVTTAEGALNDYQQQHGVVDLPQETQSMLAQAAEVQKELSQVELQRSEVRQRFTAAHPEMAALNEKATQLQGKLAAVNAKMRRLPEQELESARLARDVKVSNELYLQVLNRAQELQVVKSGTVGNARIVDRAVVPHRPIRPEPGPVLAIALLVGLMGGVALAFVRKSLDDRASDPDVIERTTGVPLYASIPHSPQQEALARRGSRRRRHGQAPVLAAIDPGDLAVESLRSLRTSLQFGLMESPSNVVAISGPGPKLGKSFLTVNLGYVLAGAGQRVLLVDGDLRRGSLHRYFGYPRSPGLSELVTGTVLGDLAVRKTDVARLDLLSTGRIPPNPAELLGSDRFQRLVAEVSSRYDLLLVDTPPVLAVTDAALVARLAGVLLLVLRAGQNPLREIHAAVKRFARAGARVNGAVLNDVLIRGRSGRYAGNYHYEYRSVPSD